MKRSFFYIFLLSLLSQMAFSQAISWNSTYQSYFDQYADVAVQQMKKYGIPASITLAQGVLESGAGRSELATKGNNHFGIKCSDWGGRRIYHDDDELGECFRAYNSAYESYVDHSVFLTSKPRYSRLFDLKATDYKGWAKGLKACGYATSPTYATRLIEIIELYELYKYDSGKYHRGGKKGSGMTFEPVQGFPSASKWGLHTGQTARQGILREVHEFNKNFFVVARRGDTFRKIADDVNMSYKRLAKYNERDRDDVLEEGERIWLKKKRRNAPKEYKGYVYTVDAGESMYTISQQFGIRIEALYKLNEMPAEYVLKVGDRLRLR